MRTTPENIQSLEPNEVFVFGSNEAGLHGAGASRTAYYKFDAVWAKGWGKNGRSFAIPTKDVDINTLPLSIIQKYVDEFLKFAKATPEYTYMVTEIGCGLAGYTPEDIAPMFKGAVGLDNVALPLKFQQILKIK